MNGYEALHNAAASIDLSDRGKIRVTGDDRARLLHALCTNDVQNLAPGRGLYAFFLNEKGRILADSLVYNLGECIWLDTEPEVKEKLLEHLDRYVIADDVTLTDETDSFACLAIEGPQSLSQNRFPLPAHECATEPFDGGFTARVSSTGATGFRVFVPVTAKDRLEHTGFPRATAEEARIVRLENGIPRYGEDISDKYLVQETQIFHAVHLNKGCYLGQEIVERVRSRGQVHRLLVPVEIEGTKPPEAGTKLFLNDLEAGEVTSAAYSSSFGKIVGLVYMRREALESGTPLKAGGGEVRIRKLILAQ